MYCTKTCIFQNVQLLTNTDRLGIGIWNQTQQYLLPGECKNSLEQSWMKSRMPETAMDFDWFLENEYGLAANVKKNVAELNVSMWWMEPVGRLILDSVTPSYFLVWQWWTCMNMHITFAACLEDSATFHQRSFLYVRRSDLEVSFSSRFPSCFWRKCISFATVVLIFTDSFPQCPVFSFIFIEVSIETCFEQKTCEGAVKHCSAWPSPIGSKILPKNHDFRPSLCVYVCLFTVVVFFCGSSSYGRANKDNNLAE